MHHLHRLGPHFAGLEFETVVANTAQARDDALGNGVGVSNHDQRDLPSLHRRLSVVRDCVYDYEITVSVNLPQILR